VHQNAKVIRINGQNQSFFGSTPPRLFGGWCSSHPIETIVRLA
jgi:hypothetical protein